MSHEKKNPPIKISPSILAGDFANLAKEVQRVDAAKADALHVDVMDGHFVPNLTIGPQIVDALNRSSDIFLDVHLMMYNPFDYVEHFIKAGADALTVHFEASEQLEELLNYIRKCGIKAGLAFCPETSMEMIPRFLDKCDQILIMTVHPGFGGQSFIESTLEKIRYVRTTCQEMRIGAGGIIAQNEEEFKKMDLFDIQVDGGINLETALQCVEAGANHLVAGTHLFAQEDMEQGITEMRNQCLSNLGV